MDSLQNLDPEQIKQLIGLLQTMLPSSKEAETKQPKKKSSSKKKSSFNKSVTRSKRIIDEERENKFLDMPESGMHKSDSLIDKKLNRFPPTPRSRSFDFVKVTCRICGRTEEISPKLVPESSDRYKCNQCSSSQG